MTGELLDIQYQHEQQHEQQRQEEIKPQVTSLAASSSAESAAAAAGFDSNNDELPPCYYSSSRVSSPVHSSVHSSSHSSSHSCSYSWMLPRVMILAMLILIVAFLAIDSSREESGYVQQVSLNFLSWVESHPLEGVFAVVAVYALATVLFIPGAILTLGCGYAFATAFGLWKGVLLASVAVWFGASLGSVASFLLGRYLFRNCVVDLAKRYPLFEAVDRAMQGNGLKIMILLRLSPLIPFNALDYISGITAISLWSYTLALLALIPGVIMYCFIGASASHFNANGDDDNNDHDDVQVNENNGGTTTTGTTTTTTDTTTNATVDESSMLRTISLVFGILFAVAGVAFASYHANKELKLILDSDNDPDNTNGKINTLPSSYKSDPSLPSTHHLQTKSHYQNVVEIC